TRVSWSGDSTGWTLSRRIAPFVHRPSVAARRRREPEMKRFAPRSEKPMATQRILDFLATRRPAGPCLVVDLDVVSDNFHAFERALPSSKIYYAVKANPAPEILRLLAALGSSFDTASVAEIEMAMDA